MDPVNPKPSTALFSSYTYHSPISSYTTSTYLEQEGGQASTSSAQDAPPPPPTSSSSQDATTESAALSTTSEGTLEAAKGKGKEKERWVMGIDEAGRGPVLGPMVYGAAFCPLSFLPTLQTLGFDDSKALNHATRNHLFSLFLNPASSTREDDEGHHELHYSTRIISPADISRDMMRGVAPINLNKQAEDATIALIGEVKRRGIDLAECYVDALGACGPWAAKLSALFPTIAFTVCPKADSLFKIVGAASIAAKITRDRWIENWIHPEPIPIVHLPFVEEKTAKRKLGPSGSSGSLKGKKKAKLSTKAKKLLKVGEEEDEGSADEEEAEEEEEEEVEEEEAERLGKNGLGSGYPSDPTTKTYLKASLHPLFGYPSLVRFSWSTVKVILDKEAQSVRWIDELGVGNRKFFSATPQDIAERDRTRVWKEVGLRGVGEL
ncbi:ribonuclease H-like domain-containing protein [Mrakia frigida]|uniref:ribonuclease H2 catalytic subunit RNH201 n=1 Tax=Mrakia frigida TaxID=29902 RepID=UPI003FCC0FA7